MKNIRVTRKFVAPQDSNYKVILSNASTCDESLLLDDRLGKDEEKRIKDEEKKRIKAEEKELQHMRDVFRTLDADHNGFLD